MPNSSVQWITPDHYRVYDPPRQGPSPMAQAQIERMNRSSSTTSPEGPDFLSVLQGMRGPTSTSSQVTQAARSPELETQIQNQVGRLNELQTGYEGAFGAQQATFNDVIQSLINAYQTRAGREGGAVGTAALTSGLTPLEATGAGQDALGRILQQMWPQVAGLRKEQAGVGIELQRALQGVGQEYGSLLTDVISPYQRGIAGTTKTGETTDILGRNRLIADYVMQQQQQQQQDAQFQAELAQALQIAQMGEAGATQRTGMTQEGAWDRAYLGEEGATERTGMGLTSTSEQAELDRQHQMDYAQFSSDLTSERDQANWDREYGEGYTSTYDDMMLVGD